MRVCILVDNTYYCRITFCYLPPCNCIVRVGIITLLLRKETAADIDCVFIVASITAVRQAERNVEQCVKEIYTHSDIYCYPNHPDLEKLFQVSEISFHHSYVYIDNINIFLDVKPCRQFTGVLWGAEIPPSVVIGDSGTTLLRHLGTHSPVGTA